MKKIRILHLCFAIFILVFVPVFVCSASVEKVEAMPFYDLQPQSLTVRASFYTSYPSSSAERKNNIMVAATSLDCAFIDVGAEFSFNDRVGARIESRGYKKAKIIVNGKFTDGVGGGVCQVSTTLYNAVLLAGLCVTEFHAHSLPVSYVAPSFDAMVNSGSADLKFVNNTHNPILLSVAVNEAVIKISIIGEPMTERYVRRSVIKEEISAPTEEVIFDYNNNYPELSTGERKTLTYSKVGYKSEGYLIKLVGDRPVSSKKIRSDKYNAVRGVIVEKRCVEIVPQSE